jgi:hypothetical protein
MDRRKGGRGLSVSERQSRLCSIVFQTNPHRNEYSLFYSSSLLSVSLSLDEPSSQATMAVARRWRRYATTKKATKCRKYSRQQSARWQGSDRGGGGNLMAVWGL